MYEVVGLKRSTKWELVNDAILLRTILEKEKVNYL